LRSKNLLLVIDRNGSTRETVRPDDAAGSICPRLAVLRYYDRADLDEFSTLETVEDDSITIKSQIGGRLIKGVIRCRMGLAIINVCKNTLVVALPCASIVWFVFLIFCPSCWKVAVWLLGAVPGVSFDFSRLSFHVPISGLLCAKLV
jgi:hypothetical protein